MKKKAIAVLVLAALLGAGGYYYFQWRATDRANLMELLPPDADLYLYIDAVAFTENSVVRRMLADSQAVPRDPEYVRFVQETGFDYLRDLYQMAIAKAGDNWVGAATVRIDRNRIAAYMKSVGSEAQDNRHDAVFSFGRQRPFRISIPPGNRPESLVVFTAGGPDSLIAAATERRAGNTNDSAAAALLRTGQLKHIPNGAKLWMLGDARRLMNSAGTETHFGSTGLNTSLFQGSERIYAWLETGLASLSVQVEDYCESQDSAKRIAGTVQMLLGLLKSMPRDKSGGHGVSGSSNVAGPETSSPNKPSNDPSVLLNGITVEQSERSIYLRWKLDIRTLEYLVTHSL